MISPEDLEAMERAWQKVEFLGVNDLENEPTRKHLANAIVSMPDYMRELLDENAKLRALVPFAREISELAQVHLYDQRHDGAKEWNHRAMKLRPMLRELES